MKTPALVRINRSVRTASFAWCLVPIGLHIAGSDPGPTTWTFLALQFLLYPQMVYWRAVYSERPRDAERNNLYLDATLFGAWAAFLGFPIWITWMLIGAALLNAVVNRGLRGLAAASACSTTGAAAWILLDGFQFTPDTTPAVSLLCMVGGIIYTCIVGVVLYTQNQRLFAARDQVKKSEARYRLIAENADDLVAMLDAEARWIYTSPSHERILDAAQLAPGGDALARVHPDDAERLREALAAGRTRQLTLRLVDREGRMRQYQSHLQRVDRNFVLVSHDVTDLRESEERMLLAAHALEGMTEGIMITSLDGTIVSVNRAFSEITGHEREEAVGRPAKDTRSGLNPPEFYDDALGTALRQGYWSGTTWSRRKNGSVYREWRSIRVVREAGGKPTHFVHVFYEVSAGAGPRDKTAGGRPAASATS
jgi:PAS domain S-box-containing protein